MVLCVTKTLLLFAGIYMYIKAPRFRFYKSYIFHDTDTTAPIVTYVYVVFSDL